MPSRASNGEGTVYRRKDGRWEGAAYVNASSGVRRRTRVYGATRAEVRARLTTVIERSARGIPIPDRSWRLGAYLDYWLPIVKRTKQPTTYLSYESISRLYLRPGLGNKPLTRLTVADLQTFLDQQLWTLT